MNIFSHYIPNKSITIDKDPAQMNQYIKRKIMNKTLACKSFNTNNKNYDAYLKLQTMSIELSEMILKIKVDITINSLINLIIQRPTQKHTGLF